MQTNPEKATLELLNNILGEWRSHGIIHACIMLEAAFAEHEEKAGFERRNIISHATMGSTTGEGMSVNDICVEISRQRNKLYQAGKDASAEREARLVGALEQIKHSVGQARVPGNDWKRELALIENTTLAALKDRTNG